MSEMFVSAFAVIIALGSAVATAISKREGKRAKSTSEQARSDAESALRRIIALENQNEVLTQHVADCEKRHADSAVEITKLQGAQEALLKLGSAAEVVPAIIDVLRQVAGENRNTYVTGFERLEKLLMQRDAQA